MSRLNANLGELLSVFANYPLEDEYPYLILDARYERIRENGTVRPQEVLSAIDIKWDEGSSAASSSFHSFADRPAPARQEPEK